MVVVVVAVVVVLLLVKPLRNFNTTLLFCVYFVDLRLARAVFRA